MSFKLSHAGDTRDIVLSDDRITCRDLRQVTTECFPSLSTTRFLLKWEDDEGDECTLSSDEELVEAVRVAKAAGQALRVSVDVVGPGSGSTEAPPPAYRSSWAARIPKQSQQAATPPPTAAPVADAHQATGAQSLRRWLVHVLSGNSASADPAWLGDLVNEALADLGGIEGVRSLAEGGPVDDSLVDMALEHALAQPKVAEIVNDIECGPLPASTSSPTPTPAAAAAAAPAPASTPAAPAPAPAAAPATGKPCVIGAGFPWGRSALENFHKAGHEQARCMVRNLACAATSAVGAAANAAASAATTAVSAATNAAVQVASRATARTDAALTHASLALGVPTLSPSNSPRHTPVPASPTPTSATPPSAPVSAPIAAPTRPVAPIMPVDHPGTMCKACGGSPIRGARFRCTTCEDFDLCERCEARDEHDPTHVFLKILIPVGRALPRGPLLPNYYVGGCKGRSSCNRKVPPRPGCAVPPSTTAARGRPLDPDAVPWTPSSVPSTPLTPGGVNKAPPEHIARFINDATVPDGTELEPGAPFVKTWLFRNDGVNTWPRSRLVYVSGDRLHGRESAFVIAKPGEVVPISIEMAAPLESGRYCGYWVLESESGYRYGHRVWVDIVVDAARTASGVAERVAEPIAPSVAEAVVAETPVAVAAQEPVPPATPVPDPAPVEVAEAPVAPTGDERFQDQQRQLAEMGFFDADQNMAVLLSVDGDITQAVTTLLNQGA